MIGENCAGDLSLKDGATQFIVTEAKMFSRLSAGVTNAKYFNQAARNVACIAEIAKRADISEHNEADAKSLGEFYTKCLEFNQFVARRYAY